MEVRFACHDMAAMRAGLALTKPVSFTIASGGYTQLRGANGIGKSTFLRQIAGLIPHDTGLLTLNEAPYHPANDRLSLKAVYLGHRDGFHDDLTGIENIELLCGYCPDEIASQPLYQRQINSFSAGQRQRLNLLTLSDDADLWLLDEPSSNLDDDNLIYLEDRIKGFIAKGGMVIAATHSDIAQQSVTNEIHLEKAPSYSQEERLL